LAPAPGVALVVADEVAVDVEVDVLVDVDVLTSVFVSVWQPASVRLSATVAITAVRSFIYYFSPKVGPRYQRR
ncbi:MAG: hypothetical protein QOG19_1701, partial [Mycobacterium sp.]|nr:hypothetical protein [Mycobacterium sp.]